MQNCRLLLESSRCGRNDLENYYCKGCNFETDLVVILKQHFREYHRKDTDCVQDQPKKDIIVKSYICQKCSFETYSVLLWIKHLESSCFDTEEECENVHTVSCSEEWHRSECCSFKTKEARVVKKHQSAKHPSHRNCSLRNHKKLQHSTDAVQWYNCDKCEFKTKRNFSLKQHKKIHLSADAVQWYSCDKCKYKTKWKGYLTKHNKIHLSADAIQWYNCDKCEFKTIRNNSLKQHNKIHLSAYAVQCYSCYK
jgi:hypothetical protein